MINPRAFPNLTAENSRITSSQDVRYNCIAWAADDAGRWWWPDPLRTSYWPEGISRVETIQAFVEAFATQGYSVAMDGSLDPKFEKVVLFEANGRPAHAARQLPSGWWSSKLGKSFDVEHTLEALDGPLYGRAAIFLARPRAESGK